ncbi:hypothetical protein M0805_006238 [Coniferiporia weirii]|nr:hypothetical protein M0805_006238 [Coniferiporia weirii]
MPQKQEFHPSYDYPDGDIVLRASDGVSFRVHSIILKLASGFFRQMLEVPRDSSESSDDAIPLTEESTIIAYLLDLIYPNGAIGTSDSAHLPAITTYDFAWALTRAADKYDLPRVLAAVRSVVMNTSALREHSLALYALACRWRWTAEARFASTGTLARPLLRAENFPILRMLDSADLCNLLALHAARKERILRCFDLGCREELDFIVYQWECGCSNEDDGTRSERFQRYWDAMRSHVIASLESSPLGAELREVPFWTKRELKLWEFKCQNCDRVILNKAYFIRRVEEVFQHANFPSKV